MNNNLDTMVSAITPDIYQAFIASVAVRRWPNGVPMTEPQLATCMQAIIAYEHRHIPLEERTGYVPPKKQACADDSHIHTFISQDMEKPIKWQS